MNLDFEDQFNKLKSFFQKYDKSNMKVFQTENKCPFT